MVDFHLKKADPEVVKQADELLHSSNAHLIADTLDRSNLDLPKVIKEMESQSKRMGHPELPNIVVAGLAEHLVHEARRGQNISAEYNSLNDTDARMVTTQFDRQKGSKITVEESNGMFVSVKAQTGNGVISDVYAPESGKSKLIHGIVGRVPVEIKHK